MNQGRHSTQSITYAGKEIPLRRTQTEVMDVLPWPRGYGFTGGDTWWRHVLSQSERERLDNLIGLALLDGKVCQQLVAKRDPSLLSSFGLSQQTQDWLTGIKASTLKDFAQAIIDSTSPAFSENACGEAA